MFTPREHYQQEVPRPKRVFNGEISSPKEIVTTTPANDAVTTPSDSAALTAQAPSQNDIGAIFRRLSQQAA